MGADLVVVTFAAVVIGFVVVDIVTFHRLQRRWKADDDAFWRRMEDWEPGIRERIAQRRERR